MSSALSSELRTRFREYIEEGLKHFHFMLVHSLRL